MLAADFQGTVGTVDVSIQLPPLKSLLVIGPNGAGKSSMMRMLLGILRPNTGRIQLNGQCLFDSDSGVCIPPEKRRIGFLPQSYALFPRMTVVENVAFGLECLGAPRAQRKARAEALLEELGIARLAHRFPSQLSGGEAQRVALARALAPAPQALLLDEPMAALDLDTRAQVRGFLVPYLRACGLPTIVISHDPEDIDVLGSTIAVIERGRVIQCGDAEELYDRPATPFVRSFIGAKYDSVPPSLRAGRGGSQRPKPSLRASHSRRTFAQGAHFAGGAGI